MSFLGPMPSKSENMKEEPAVQGRERRTGSESVWLLPRFSFLLPPAQPSPSLIHPKAATVNTLATPVGELWPATGGAGLPDCHAIAGGMQGGGEFRTATYHTHRIGP